MTSLDPSAVASTNRVVHLEDARMRRRERGELATEGLAAFTLLSAVQTSYEHGGMDAFMVLNAIAGAALAIVVIRGIINLRRNRDASSPGTSVIGVFGGLATLAEGVHRLHTAQFTFGHRHFALGVLTTFAGLLTTAVALMMERLEHRRALTISDDGIRMRLNRFRRFDVPWTDIVEINLTEKEARLVSSSAKARIVPLGRLVNREEVSEALIQAAEIRGVTVTPLSARRIGTPA
jgi:hypothetical protein